MVQSERPRFLALRLEHGFTSQQVAQEAGVSLSEEYRAEIGCTVEAEVAERVRAAFSRLTGQAWSLADMAITTRKEASYEQRRSLSYLS